MKPKLAGFVLVISNLAAIAFSLGLDGVAITLTTSVQG